MKLDQVKNFYSAFNALLGNPSVTPTVAFLVRKNQKALSDHFEKIALNEKLVYSPEYQQYEQARTQVCLLHCIEDANGNPKISRQADGQHTYDIDPARQEAFEQQIQDLAQLHMATIQSYTRAVTEYSDLLQETVEVDLIPIPLKEIAKMNNVPVDVIDALFDIIEY